MLGMLIAWDVEGRIIATKDYHVVYDESKPDRPVLGLVDWGEMEQQGLQFGTGPGRSPIGRWRVEGAVASGYWPQWLGSAALQFRVELDGDRPVALVHRESGRRLERRAVEQAITERVEQAPEGQPVDIRDLVGGPNRPLALDEEGRIVAKAAPPALDVPIRSTS